MTEAEWIEVFGDNLRDILLEFGVSRRDLAYQTGLSESTIGRYINKQMAPSIFAIINIAHALNCSTDELIDFGDRII